MSVKSRQQNERMREFVRLILLALELMGAWFATLRQIGGAMRPRRARRHRPWRIRIGRRVQEVALTQADVDHLLQRHRDLKDNDQIAATAARFRLPESDYFADPAHVERLLRRFLEESPPWLNLGRVLAGNEPGAEGGQEVVWREQETRTVEEVTLFVPDDTWRDKPLSSLTLRPARSLSEAWQARLLDQVLPPELLLDRISRGEVLIPVHPPARQRLEFRGETRPMEVVRKRNIAVPIEIEGGGGNGGQLLYFLLDGSASMQGKSAVLALSVIAATVRANMGRANTRYLFRRYENEEALWPPEVAPPLQARTVSEKDAFLATLLRTNFRGDATHLNHALNVAARDIEHVRQEEQLEAAILLVTDGRAELLENTHLRLREGRIHLHTVMVTPERNPSLEAISESFTALDIQPDLPPPNAPHPTPPATPEPRRAFHV
jgi:hypothetical protein